MKVGVVRPELGIPCSRCGSRTRSTEDRYRLVLPLGWSITGLRPWTEERGLTIRQLNRAITIEKICLACQSKDGKRG
jgi:hypothetical protein